MTSIENNKLQNSFLWQLKDLGFYIIRINPYFYRPSPLVSIRKYQYELLDGSQSTIIEVMPTLVKIYFLNDSGKYLAFTCKLKRHQKAIDFLTDHGVIGFTNEYTEFYNEYVEYCNQHN